MAEPRGDALQGAPQRRNRPSRGPGGDGGLAGPALPRTGPGPSGSGGKDPATRDPPRRPRGGDREHDAGDQRASFAGDAPSPGRPRGIAPPGCNQRSRIPGAPQEHPRPATPPRRSRESGDVPYVLTFSVSRKRKNARNVPAPERGGSGDPRLVRSHGAAREVSDARPRSHPGSPGTRPGLCRPGGSPHPEPRRRGRVGGARTGSGTGPAAHRAACRRQPGRVEDAHGGDPRHRGLAPATSPAAST